MVPSILFLAALVGCPGNNNDSDSGSGKDLDDTAEIKLETAPVYVYTGFVDGTPEACLVTIDCPSGKTTGNTNPDVAQNEVSGEAVVGETCTWHAGEPDVLDSQGNPLHTDPNGQRWASVGDELRPTDTSAVEVDGWWNFYTHMVADLCEIDYYDYRGDYFETIECGAPEIEVVEDALVNYDDPSFNGFILGDQESLEVIGTSVELITDYDATVTDSDMLDNPESGKKTIRIHIEWSDGTAMELTIEGYEL